MESILGMALATRVGHKHLVDPGGEGGLQLLLACDAGIISGGISKNERSRLLGGHSKAEVRKVTFQCNHVVGIAGSGDLAPAITSEITCVSWSPREAIATERIWLKARSNREIIISSRYLLARSSP